MLAAGTTLGPYQVLAPIGAGGMGEVYRARDTRLRRDVAIKVIRGDAARDLERVRRFEQEARAAGALSHTNVCAIHDLGTHEGAPYVVMELLEGETLRARLRSGPIPARKAIAWAAQAAQGLAAAHAKGIIHRDLKPENLFLTTDGRVKVLDFGLAKLTRPEAMAGEGDATVSLMSTETGAILGTAGYMAPEQVRGERADARTDLFALGAVLYELVTGRRAFHGATYLETGHAILNDEPEPLNSGGGSPPRGLEPIVRRCLEKNPDERFQSARDLAFDLQTLINDTAALTPTLGEAPSTGGTLRSGRFIAACCVVSALFGAACGVIIMQRRHSATEVPLATYRRLTAERGAIWNARFGPGGETVLYAAAWGGRPPEIWEVRPGIAASRAVGVSRTNLLAVSARGMMAVTLGHDRWQARAPAHTLAEVPISGGAPREIFEKVIAADWSPDGRTLAVSHLVGGKCRLEMPPGRAIYETVGGLPYLRVSPDGRRVAVVENPLRAAFWGSLAILDTTGRVIARTREWKGMFGLAWSPDGREVWFASGDEVASSELRAVTLEGKVRVVQRFPGWIMLHDIDPRGELLISRSTAECRMRGRGPGSNEERELGWLDWPNPVDISSDGRTLIFDEQGIGGGPNYSVCMRGMDGSPPVRLGDGSGFSLSPDGKLVLAVRQGPPSRLALLPTGVGDAIALPGGGIVKYSAGGWLPDGKGVVFAGAEAGRDWRTYVQDVKGGLPRAITAEGFAGSRVSPDGHFVAVVSGGRLFACPVAGGDPVPVADLLPDELVLRWGPDGQAIEIVRSAGSRASVTRIDLRTGRRAVVGTYAVGDSIGVGRLSLVLGGGGAYAYRYARFFDDLFVATGLK